LDIYKSKLQSDSEDPINDTLEDFKNVTKRNIGDTLLRINSEHSEISPLLSDTIQHHLNELGPQQESRINQIIASISQNREFIAGLKEKDFVGTLYETMVASEFDKQDGRFFTPKNIILINVEIMKILLETRNEDITSLSICDPCCGSGRFLIYGLNLLYVSLKIILYLIRNLMNKSKNYMRNIFME
jgi:type I restriction-modification system DNA methylase subunit